MGLIMITFVLGIFWGLDAAFWITIFLSILLYMLTTYVCVTSRNITTVKNNIFNKSLIPIVTAIVSFLWCDLGMKGGNTSDDFTHWIYIVKEMVNLNDFGTNVKANAMFASYPPGMALFQYFICRLYKLTSTGGFSEWRCYFAYHILMISMFFPFLNEKKKVWTQLLTIGIFFLMPTAFYMSYYDLSIEPILAVMTGTVFARIILEKEKDWSYTIYVLMGCFVLTLMKDAGLVFSIFLVIAFILDRIMRCTSEKIDKKIIITSLFAWLSVIIPKLMWNVQLQITGVRRSFPQTVSLLTLFNVIIGKDMTYRRSVLKDFIKAIFSRTVLIDSPWSTSEIIQPKWGVPYLYLALIFFVQLAALNLIYYNANTSTSSRGNTEYIRRKRLLTVFIGMFLTYVLGIGVAYISNFSETEAKMLAAFSRYIQVPFLFTYILIVLYALDIVADRMEEHKYALYFMVIFTIVSCIAPRQYAVDYVLHSYVEQSYARRQKYEYMSDLININCSSDDKICFIDQNAWLYPYVTIRFDVRPIYMGLIGKWSSWYISDGMFGSESDNVSGFLTALNGYDYLAIYQTDDFLIDTYSDIFDKPITPNSLWLINKNKGILEKID
jgi:hypothetical protein